MVSEIKIILEEGASNKAKGNCFEDLIRNLLTLHQYKIRQNIRFTGMELDLLAEHRQRKNETVYVEAKAKDKVSSIELRTFFANVFHNKADFGYFFRTQELEFDAGGLLQEYRNDIRYKNLMFFEPNDMIQMLLEENMIFEPRAALSKYFVSKKILAVTYLGDYFIYLINESNAFPTKFIIVNAKHNSIKVSNDFIEILKAKIDEIKTLELISDFNNYHAENNSPDRIIEAISEVQESENWYDYRPASSDKKHFVGRDVIRTQILSYFKDIHSGNTCKRIFFLNGKSGWGKSSLVLEIKNRCRNQHFKNKFYGIAIDTRSATSENFIALAIKKLINKAISECFITNDIFTKNIAFTSYIDLLSSESMSLFLQRLKDENKFLVLVFDQFEDVFRKKDYFKLFYKFLSDLTDKKPNIIVGFSWKSDFYLQSDDPNYHIWQQSREQANEFTISEFGEKEIDGIIKQLEGSVGILDKSIKNRIKESSQGLPWLTKKLCIHIYDQIDTGLAKGGLIESNLNISLLFKKDEERVEPNELRALKLIAKRAYDGNFFEETEVGDIIDSGTIGSLLHKRLIIRSGANYNIYWDIFRDYLVTGQIPPIGESYLLRQPANSCLDVFLLFDKSKKQESISSLLKKHSKGIGEEALYNILIELRNIGIIRKENEYYSVSEGIELSKDGFIDYLKEKFQNYTPYLALKRNHQNKISKDVILSVLRNIFKQDFRDTTWMAYANNLISWLLLADLDISNKILDSPKRRNQGMLEIKIGDVTKIVPRSSKKEILEILPLLSADIGSVNRGFFRDLLLMDIIDTNKCLTSFGKQLIRQDELERISLLKQRVLSLPKMQELKKDIISEPKITAKALVKKKPADFFNVKQNTSKQIYASKALSWLR